MLDLLDPPAAREQPRRRRRTAGVLGVLGEVLVVAGVLVALFLVWQLWWTSVVAGREAAAVVEEFREALTPAAAEVVPLRTDEPPVLAPVGPGSTIGVLTVPRWEGLTNNAMPVVEGTDLALLDRGLAGRYTGTQQLGEVGNVALAGHRRTHGDSFRYVDRLVAGDHLVVETATTWYVYAVTGDQVVLPTESDVLLPVPRQPGVAPTERLLTLTTCHSPSTGEYGNSHRWITYATFIGWLDRADGTPAELDAPGAV